MKRKSHTAQLRKLLVLKPRKSMGAEHPAGELNPEIVGEVEIDMIRYDSDFADKNRVTDIQEETEKFGHGVTWLRVHGVDAIQMASLREALGIHRLLMEDVVNQNQRPKVDDFGEQLGVFLKVPDEDQQFHQLAMVLIGSLVVTFEPSSDVLDPVERRILEGRGKIRTRNSGYLGYSIVDAVVDTFQPLVAKVAEQGAALEEHDGKDQRAFHETYVQLRNQIFAVRRELAPTREMVLALQKVESDVINELTRQYLSDTFDHATQSLEGLHDVREIATSVVEFEMNRLSFELNEVMRVLTIFSTIFIPLSFLAGIWGMNFDASKSPFNMPELSWAFGYPAALGLMVVLATTILFIYRKKGWL